MKRFLLSLSSHSPGLSSNDNHAGQEQPVLGELSIDSVYYEIFNGCFMVVLSENKIVESLKRIIGGP